MKKIIILGVIVLFFGMGFQPAFVYGSKFSFNKIDNEEKITREFFKINNPASIIGNKYKTFGHLLYQQLPIPPLGNWTFRISDLNSGRCVHDNFFLVDMDFCEVHWWGLSMVYPGEAGDPIGMVFEIIIWDNLLETPQCIYQVTPTAIPTGDFYAGFEMYSWLAHLDPCCTQFPEGWLSIQSISSPNNCYFLWAGSDDGDLYCYHEGEAYPDQYSDCAFELSWGVFKPPLAPTINGPNIGKPEQELIFIFNSLDPDGDDVRYIIDWGDPTYNTTDFVPSGTDKAVSHKWNEESIYKITAYAEDYLTQSPSTTKRITILRIKTLTNNVLLVSFLERYPLIQKLLLSIKWEC